MKLTNFTKGFVALVFVGAFLLPSKADAKMFGKECETVTSGGGGSCVVTRYICKQRFFWINVGTNVEYGGHDCSALM